MKTLKNDGGQIGQKQISRQRHWRLIEESGKIVTDYQTLQLALKKLAA
jgi:hypothetical protein